MNTCNDCHSFQINHPKLDPRFRGKDEYGLCMNPFAPHTTWHRDSTRCVYWVEREPEKQQCECPQCQAQIWKWLHHCPGCGEDLREKCKNCGMPIEGDPPVCQCKIPWSACSPRRKRDNRPEGGSNSGWLRMRRAEIGY